MHREAFTVVVAIVGAALCVVGGCAGGAGNLSQPTPQLQVSALEGTPQSAVDTLDVSVVPAGGGFNVAVATAPETPSGSLAFRVDFDAVTFSAAGLEGCSADGALGLALLAGPGRIDCGVAGQADAELPAGTELLSFRLEAGSRNVSNTQRYGGAVTAKPRNLDLRQNDAGNWELSWDYTNPGDTNQNGEVSMSDLVPLAVNYGDRLSGNWDDAMRHVDCDGNAEINSADIVPISSGYLKELYSYKIQMSMDGESGFITVGELELSEQEVRPDQAIRFTYTFGQQYVSGAWYRVRPMTRSLEYGTPSEAICEGLRMLSLDPTRENIQVTVNVRDLPAPLRQMNAVRIVYPAAFEYVKESYNAGKIGGEKDTVDGLWGSFAENFLFQPKSMLEEIDLGNGRKAMDFNLTVVDPLLPESPAGTGALFNFQLTRVSSGPLVLSTQTTSEDGLLRTYFTDAEENQHLFGTALELSAY